MMTTLSELEGQGPSFTRPSYPPVRESTARYDDSPSRPPVSPITPSVTLAQLVPGKATVHPPLPHQLDRVIDSTSKLSSPAPITSPTGMAKSSPQEQHLLQHQRPHQVQLSQTHPVQEPRIGPQHISTGQDTPAQRQEDGFIPPPAPVPFEEDDNTDIIAVRAALALLQTQKEKAKRDIKTLAQLQRSLHKDPESFAQALAAGEMTQARLPKSDPLRATFPGLDEDGAEKEEDDDDGEEQKAQAEESTKPQYPKIPARQKIFRCPPVNWAKYHVVGESLDRMHEEQRKRPTLGQPSSGPIPQAGNPYHTPADGPTGPPAAEHHIYKAYDSGTDILPAKDSLRDGVQTRRSSKRP